MTSEQLAVERIRKLLALSTNNRSPEEASAALAKAQKLMARHDLSEADVNIDMGTAKTRNGKNETVWENLLAHQVKNAFSCEVVRSGGREGVYFLFIGIPHQAQVAAHAYQVLFRQVVAARAKYIKSIEKFYSRVDKTARADAYAYAWVEAATDRLSDMSAATPVDLIKNYIGRMFLPLDKGRVRRSRIPCLQSDLDAGRRDGSDVALNDPVSGFTPLQLT